ncbi:amidase [Microbacterium testaceum]|nr:amidase [Microbacterium testaceum]
MTSEALTVVDADIDSLRHALDAGRITSVELVARYLNRIAAYDRSGIRLNSVPVLDPRAFAAARASDLRRAQGRTRGPLDGIPFTAKDSYRVEGLPVASGSPAFRDLIAGDDAFAVERLREAGAVFLGLTNMPPMAAGGMQRGVYGRAESPYNGDYLASAFGSGSSNGSGTATAASFCAFGLGEETWSSGRAPASHNALVAYTPSRGMISVRGNWPLVPTMDVVVPHTRSVADLQLVLDAVVVDDAETEGDLWRTQPFIDLPLPSEVRPESFAALEPLPLAGLRLAVPRIYVNGDPDNASPIVTRDSVMALWNDLRADLEAAGAEVVETAFPVVERYEKLHAGDEDFLDRGFVTRTFLDDEVGDLAVWAMDTFLRTNADPRLPRLADAEAALIFPHPPGALPDRYGIWHYDISYDIGEYVDRAQQWNPDWRDVPSLEEGLRGLEHTRRVDFEEWMRAGGIDAVVFPTQADVGPADADVNPASADIAWRNGVWVSNGNLVPRHLGIPTVTVPMGTMADTRMPVGLTLAGPAYSDTRLVQLAQAIAALGERRTTPPRTPALPDEALFADPRPAAEGDLSVAVDDVVRDGERVSVTAIVAGGTAVDVALFVDGVRVPARVDGDRVSGVAEVSPDLYGEAVSEWVAPYGPLVVIAVRDAGGAVAGTVATASDSSL